jgi:hypothetical protein
VERVLATQLSREQRHEVASWITAHQSSVPESVGVFFAMHYKYLAADGDLGRRFDETCRELRRALGIIPSSERRRSGDPLARIAGRSCASVQDERQRLEGQRERSDRLSQWHAGLNTRHTDNAKRIKDKLEKMKTEPTIEPMMERECGISAMERKLIEQMPVESIELSEEQQAEVDAIARRFVEHLEQGEGRADAELKSVNETLMPGGAVLSTEHVENLAAEASEELTDATVVKTLNDKRVRYDISINVSRIELDVDKKVVVKGNGERTVIAASTAEYGPARYSVTWSALATLAVLVGQFAFPLNRLATLFSCVGKRFTAGGLSRLLHYVAVRLVAIYIELGDQLADGEILAGDDTPCRVLEVNTYFEKLKSASAIAQKDKPPWAHYRTKAATQEYLTHRQQQPRADGNQQAQCPPDEEPSLGVLIGRYFDFESERQDGQGAKQSINTTVISGRSVAADPRSLIVFYRSHLGGCGNLMESILHSRRPSAKEVIVQTDLSTTNLIRDPELLARFIFKYIGCSAHARRPFALYEQEDPMVCPHILHLFKGLAMHEERLDAHGRNRHNVLAVRQADSRALWEQIRELATELQARWSKATKLGTGARYVLRHYDKLTAYLDDPRLEPTNNLRERMLRTEKLIENSSMFRRSLEGRFVLDIIRTVLQTAVAAGVPIQQYLMSVLREDPDEITNHPERFTPRAWADRAVSEHHNS